MIRFNVDIEADKTGKVKKYYIRNCVIRPHIFVIIFAMILGLPFFIFLTNALTNADFPIEGALLLIVLVFMILL